MRAFFLFLVIVNLAFYGVWAGYFGPLLDDGREPGRLTAQVNPEGLKMLPQDADTRPALVKMASCLEFGGFANDDVRRVEPQLNAFGLGARMTLRHVDEQAGYIVFLPPFKTRPDADRAAGELKRIGVTDFFVIQDPGPFHLAISLGVFRTEDAAKAQLTALAQLGVRNAKTGQRSATLAKTYYDIRNVESDLLAKLTELKSQFPNEDLHECPATLSAATSSSGT